MKINILKKKPWKNTKCKNSVYYLKMLHLFHKNREIIKVIIIIHLVGGDVDLIGTPIQEVNSDNDGLIDLHNSSDDVTQKIGNEVISAVSSRYSIDSQRSQSVVRYDDRNE